MEKYSSIFRRRSNLAMELYSMPEIPTIRKKADAFTRWKNAELKPASGSGTATFLSIECTSVIAFGRRVIGSSTGVCGKRLVENNRVFNGLSQSRCTGIAINLLH